MYPCLIKPGLGQGLGKRLKLDPRNAREKFGVCHIIAKYHVPNLWRCISGWFSRTKRLQNSVW